MVTKDGVVAVILARGGSKGIPGKNTRLLLGVPLLVWTIRQVRESGIRSIFVSTDDPRIAAIALEEGSDVIDRPSAFAGDQATSESALLHAVDELGLDDEAIIVMPQVTSPVRRAADFEAVVGLVESGAFDSAFSGCRLDDICVWNVTAMPMPVTYDPLSRSLRQDRPAMLVENGALYSFRVRVLREYGSRIGGRVGVHEMPTWSIHEIDEPADIRLCEVLMEEYLGVSREYVSGYQGTRE